MGALFERGRPVERLPQRLPPGVCPVPAEKHYAMGLELARYLFDVTWTYGNHWNFLQVQLALDVARDEGVRFERSRDGVPGVGVNDRLCAAQGVRQAMEDRIARRWWPFE